MPVPRSPWHRRFAEGGGRRANGASVSARRTKRFVLAAERDHALTRERRLGDPSTWIVGPRASSCRVSHQLEESLEHSQVLASSTIDPLPCTSRQAAPCAGSANCGCQQCDCARCRRRRKTTPNSPSPAGLPAPWNPAPAARGTARPQSECGSAGCPRRHRHVQNTTRSVAVGHVQAKYDSDTLTQIHPHRSRRRPCSLRSPQVRSSGRRLDS